MRCEGRRRAELRTDDFRVAAIKTYLKLGFEPLLVAENQRRRWRDVLAAIGRGDLVERFAGILEGPIRAEIAVE
jgi:mycothiol synthase